MLVKTEIIEKLKLVIEDVSLGMVNRSTVNASSRLIEDLNLDSLDYATVLVQTEEETGIKVKEDGINWSLIKTVDQLAQLFIDNQ